MEVPQGRSPGLRPGCSQGPSGGPLTLSLLPPRRPKATLYLRIWLLLWVFSFAQAQSWESWWWQVGERFSGHPYLWGGNGPGGFDCSGMVVYVYRHLGVRLPRTSREMWARLPPVRGELRAGDLLFFGQGGRVDHVAVYLGRGYMLHASGRWGRVVVEPWTALRGRYLGARRPPSPA